jgi:hypothetical protein
MHPKQIRKVLDDEETFDVAQAAEAVIEDNRIREKKDKPKSREASLAAFQAHKARKQDDEAFRQSVAKAWKRTHK